MVTLTDVRYEIERGESTDAERVELARLGCGMRACGSRRDARE